MTGTLVLIVCPTLSLAVTRHEIAVKRKTRKTLVTLSLGLSEVVVLVNLSERQTKNERAPVYGGPRLWFRRGAVALPRHRPFGF